MSRHMSKPAAAAIEQLPLSDRGLASELRSPVAEPLQRQSVQLAILALVQCAACPVLMMRPPETLQLSAFLIAHSCHDPLLPSRIAP